MANPFPDLLPCPFCGTAPKSSGTQGIWCDNDDCAIVGTVFSGWPRHWNRRATPPSPSTAPEVDEVLRLLDDAIPFRLDRIAKGECVDASVAAIRNALPTIRAALASRPAEVDDEWLPPLPNPVRASSDQGYLGYTAEQYRQGQRDAVAADRARRQVDGK